MHELPVTLPRSAFTPREVARPGDLWRLFQDIAVGGSSAAGWPPERYRAEGVSFVVRAMTVVHHRELVFGEATVGRTWPSAFKRGVLFRRECRLVVDGAPAASATQEWVHVSADVRLTPASAALVDAFAIEAHDASVTLPEFVPIEGARTHHFALTCWNTWMDPLGHANHPIYIEWCDEGLARAMVAEGLDPSQLVARAEHARFKSGAQAADELEVETTAIGTTDDAVVFRHRVVREGEAIVTATTVRGLVGEPRGLLALR